MKRRMNVIQINGFKGLVMAAGIVACLIAGFIAFPGLVMKTAWNFISAKTGLIPTIEIIQGILLWGIIVVSYLTFRRSPFFVEFKSTNDLSREEMDEVMQKIRMERQADILTRAMMKAKELESIENIDVQKEEQEVSENSQNIS